MPCFKPVSTAAVLVCLTALPSSAEITGAEVWSDWKTYLESFGYETTAAEGQGGNILTVSDITMVIPVPEGEGDVTLSLGALAFIENADDTVTIAWPEQMPIRYRATMAGAPVETGTVMLTQTGSSMVASGSQENLAYRYVAEQMSISLQDMTVGGTLNDPGSYKALVTLTGIDGTSRTTGDDLRRYAQDFSIADVTYAFENNVADGPDDSPGEFTGTMRGLTMTSTSVLPQTPGEATLTALVADGAEIIGNLAYESGSSDVDILTPTGEFEAQTSSAGGTFGISMTQAGLDYEIAQEAVAMTVQTADFPFPVSLNIENTAFNLALPIGVSDDPQPFALGFKLGDFTISDVIWNLFDPGLQLPRDPATVELDLTGTARVLTDLFDPAALAATDQSAELNALSIETLLIDIIGAQLSGAGAFTFDASDTTTFNGMPRPEGALDLELVGANALLDTLVTMGLLPQEQAMGARMMMGIFGVPQGDDTITSKIEVNAEGHLLANGQRLQ